LKYVLFVASGFVESSIVPAKMIQQSPPCFILFSKWYKLKLLYNNKVSSHLTVLSFK